MDPLTQSLLGGAVALAVLQHRLGRMAFVMGAVGGELPDIDIVLPPSDPAVPFEMHRHFTHALVFIPAGGLLAALLFLLFPRWRTRWKLVIAATTVGCATHGMIDTCTSYGTYLLWPFVNERLAWDIISIIDPLFTLALAIGIVAALVRRSPVAARVSLVVCLLYLGLGVVQHRRARAVQARLAEQRGDVIERGRVMPTLGNLIVWRSIYESGGHLQADAVRAGRPGSAAARRGGRLPVRRVGDLPSWARDDDRIRRVYAIFESFADGYTAVSPDRPLVIGDMRYSMDPAGFAPIWGIQLTAGPFPGVRWAPLVTEREMSLGDLWRDVKGTESLEP